VHWGRGVGAYIEKKLHRNGSLSYYFKRIFIAAKVFWPLLRIVAHLLIFKRCLDSKQRAAAS
jgi:hypothetical protein